MNLRIYLIVEDGADRVYVQTTFPAWYKKPADGRRAELLSVDVELPEAAVVDGVIHVQPFNTEQL